VPAGALALSLVIVLVVSGVLAGAGGRVTPGAGAPGTALPDQGDGPARPGFRYDSSPPTSGPHATVPVRSDAVSLDTDQLLTALAGGDVVVAYGTRRPPPGLRGLGERLAGPFSPALAASGQAVILARRPGSTGLTALAWARRLHVSAPADPRLRAFILAWLGRGARPRGPGLRRRR
jgi:hypothetical protein